jgi:general secretion pathway protein K
MALHRSPRPLPARQRGAALLLAMMILALVTTLTAGMVWHQRRAVQVEAAERARVQAGWVLRGALDWSRLIIREDLRAAQRRANFYTWGRDTWGTPLAEVSLSSFLAADKDNNADAGLDAAISGGIADAQGKLNLRGLVDGAGKPVPLQVQGFQRLCDLLGAPGDVAARVAEILSKSLAPQTDTDTRGPPIRPDKLLDLAWQGLNVETLNRLAPYIELLPLVTPVNVNTAPREVLVAAIDNLDTGSAERLVQRRQRAPFETLAAVEAALGGTIKVDPVRVGVSSAWFEISGQLRLDERVVEERSLVQRDGDRVVVRRRERHSFEVAPR